MTSTALTTLTTLDLFYVLVLELGYGEAWLGEIRRAEAEQVLDEVTHGVITEEEGLAELVELAEEWDIDLAAALELAA